MPIVTDKYVYCHMPKTGGTWMTNYLQQEHEGVRALSGHSAASELDPAVYEGKTLFGTVRDPWSWYLSWYNHATRNKGARLAMKTYCDGREPSFHEVLRNLLERRNVPDYYNLIWRAPGQLARRDEWLAYEGGLYSFWFDEIYGGLVWTFIDTSRLYEATEQLLGVVIDRRKYRPKNAARDVTPDNLNDIRAYNSELIDLVEKYDGELAQKLNFSPFQSSKREAVFSIT